MNTIIKRKYEKVQEKNTFSPLSNNEIELLKKGKIQIKIKWNNKAGKLYIAALAKYIFPEDPCTSIYEHVTTDIYFSAFKDGYWRSAHEPINGVEIIKL